MIKRGVILLFIAFQLWLHIFVSLRTQLVRELFAISYSPILMRYITATSTCQWAGMFAIARGNVTHVVVEKKVGKEWIPAHGPNCRVNFNSESDRRAYAAMLCHNERGLPFIRMTVYSANLVDRSIAESTGNSINPRTLRGGWEEYPC